MWLALWILVLLIGAAGAFAVVSGRRFEARVDREAGEMGAAAARAESRPIDRGLIDALPAPVGRYLSKAIRNRDRAVRTVRLRHGGTFRPSLDGSWLPIRGEQYFSADPPGFVWWGRVRMAPGVWIDARDRSVNGAGNMLVALESIATLADSSGPALDRGALLRLLGEMSWFPTALLDRRYVEWHAMDDRHAGATLRVSGREVTATFEFGDDDLPRAFTADRERDLGGGRSEVTPFVGECSDYRETAGLLVPHRMTAVWIVNGERKEYARFVVEDIFFDSGGH